MIESNVGNETNSTMVRNYSTLIWILPLVSGILLIIAILTPIAYYSQYGFSRFWWMWDFVSMSFGTSTEYHFIFDIDLIVTSIITTAVMLFSAINLFILARKTKLASSNLRIYTVRSVISAFLSIGVIIYYMISIDSWYFSNFWDFYDLSFGTILPFISAFLSFIEVGAYRYFSKKKESLLFSVSSVPKQEILAKKVRTLRILSRLFPLIAGYLAIIAILCPTAYFDNGYSNWSWWMWDFIMMKASSYPAVFLFISQGEYLFISLIVTAVILFSAINLFMTSTSIRKTKSSMKDFFIWSTISAALSVGVMIYYIIAIESTFYNGLTLVGTLGFPAGYQFWELFSPGLGAILPYISATLSIAGIFVFRNYIRQKKRIPSDELEILLQEHPLKKFKIPFFGIAGLIVGGLGVFFLIYNFPRWYSGTFEYLIFPMILCIIACIFGIIGRKQDLSKGFAAGGLTIGVLGTIASLCILGFLIFISTYLLYADI
jgi:hypothetical protein